MTSSLLNVADIIEAIETRQPVLNASAIPDDVLFDKSRCIERMATLGTAAANTLSFVANSKYISDLSTTRAGIVLISPTLADRVPPQTIGLHVHSPYLAYASVSQRLAAAAVTKPTIHPTAVIGDRVCLDAGVHIEAYATIGDDVSIGSDTIIGSHTSIERGVSIGSQCVIKPHVCIAHDCQIGDHVRIHAHACIGMEGFGFAPNNNDGDLQWERIAQLGRVVIGDDVRIGAHTCVDRGAIEDTVIEDHVIIDNLVQIAHNVHIGSGTAIAANTGIAGSTHIGKRCVIGGAVGIAGHLYICDEVTLTGMTMVTKSIKQAGSYSSGVPVMPSSNWRRAAVKFRQSGR